MFKELPEGQTRYNEIDELIMRRRIGKPTCERCLKKVSVRYQTSNGQMMCLKCLAQYELHNR